MQQTSDSLSVLFWTLWLTVSRVFRPATGSSPTASRPRWRARRSMMFSTGSTWPCPPREMRRWIFRELLLLTLAVCLKVFVLIFFRLPFPGEASVHPWRSPGAQEGDGGGRTQTQNGTSGVNFRVAIKLNATHWTALCNETLYCSLCRREIWRWSLVMTTFWTYRVRRAIVLLIMLPLRTCKM